MCRSNSPRVFGFVIIKAATSSPMASASASGWSTPSAPEGTVVTSIAVQRRAGGVRAVGRVGHQHARALVAARLVIGADHHDAGELALGAGRRLERHAIHAR